MVAQPLIPALRSRGSFCEFEAKQVYKLSSRPARVIQQASVSQKISGGRGEALKGGKEVKGVLSSFWKGKQGKMQSNKLQNNAPLRN